MTPNPQTNPHPTSYDTKLDLDLAETGGEVLSRIADESRDTTEQGEWFEQLFCDVAANMPELDISTGGATATGQASRNTCPDSAMTISA